MTSIESAIKFLDSRRYDDEDLSLTRFGNQWVCNTWSEATPYVNDDFVWIALDEDSSKWIVTKRYFDSRVQFGYDFKTKAIDAVIEYLRDFEE